MNNKEQGNLQIPAILDQVLEKFPTKQSLRDFRLTAHTLPPKPQYTTGAMMLTSIHVYSLGAMMGSERCPGKGSQALLGLVQTCWRQAPWWQLLPHGDPFGCQTPWFSWRVLGVSWTGGSLGMEQKAYGRPTSAPSFGLWVGVGVPQKPTAAWFSGLLTAFRARLTQAEFQAKQPKQT